MPGSRRSRRRGVSGARAAGVPATRKPPRDRVHRVEVVGDLDAHAAEELALEVRRLVERAGRGIAGVRIVVSAASRKGRRLA